MPQGGSIVARPKLKGIDGLAPQAVDFAVQLDSTPENLPGQNALVHDGLMLLRQCVKGGAWPHEVRGVTCLLNCANGQDPHCMLVSQCFVPVTLGGVRCGTWVGSTPAHTQSGGIRSPLWCVCWPPFSFAPSLLPPKGPFH